MANLNEYIVFEADQVLTNDHLNETFNYLDQQNRWTRNKLIGIGIVCGFNIIHKTGIIEVTKGCGVTSQGYLILKNADKYAYLMPYSPADQPADLPFKYPGNLPFYKPFCVGKTIYQLLTDDDYEALEENKKSQALTLSSQKSTFLDDYVVVLFLEATETDLKNCSAFDCINKGEKMQFNLRALLVAKKDLPNVKAVTISTGEKDRLRSSLLDVEIEKARLSHEINFKRYNVPYTQLNNSEDVIKAFVKIVDDATLQEVANAYIYAYEKHAALLNETANPFTGLFKELRDYRDLVLKEYPIFIQYFYDFVDDLINAYYEFCVKISGIVAECCPDENLFPLHLVLGDASKDTSATVHDAWRNYFIYSPLFAKSGNEVAEMQFLFRRMQIMAKTFTILIEEAKRQATAIKITPSQYGYPWISQRAIPYYYHIVKGSTAIYNYWNYYKTSHGNEVFNLSYNANLYNHAKAVLQPLLYDIEHYNFFRIEGHIGENYQNVLRNLLGQRLEYNLPFDIVAISADTLRSTAKLPQCNMQDLETDYKLIISEFACKVHTPFCFLTKLPYPPTDTAFDGLKDAAGLDTFTVYRAKAMAEFTRTNLVQTTAYAKGDFMRSYCAPAENTIGSYYLQSLNSSDMATAEISDYANFTNERASMFAVYDLILRFINAVEELMLVLKTASVSTLDMDRLQRQYGLYTGSATQLTLVLAELISSNKLKLSAFLKAFEFDALVDEFFILSTVCIDERLQTLTDEYTRRMQLFQAQNTFINYYRKHPGLEHKAGVPKGGTFVLVYYEEQDVLTNAAGTVFENVGNQLTVMQAPKDVYISKEYDADTDRMIRAFVNNCKDAPPESKRQIIDRLNLDRPIGRRFNIPDGAVIADFYVPYMCCSDCPPIAYILPKEKDPEPVTPTIETGDSYCDNDDKEEPIDVNPGKGKITDENGNEIDGINNENYTFIPSRVGAGIYNLIYTLDGVKSAPATLTILATPKDGVFKLDTIEPRPDGSFVVVFTPEIQDDSFMYTWTFDKGFSPSTSMDQSPKVVATIAKGEAEIKTFVTLQISNGTCHPGLERNDYIINVDGIHQTDAPPPAEGQITGEIKNGGEPKISTQGEVTAAPPPGETTIAIAPEAEAKPADETKVVADVKPTSAPAVVTGTAPVEVKKSAVAPKAVAETKAVTATNVKAKAVPAKVAAVTKAVTKKAAVQPKKAAKKK